MATDPHVSAQSTLAGSDRLAILAGARALVTGGNGFLGGALCRRLSGLGVEVHATSRFEQPARLNGARWWRSSLMDTRDVDALFGQIEPDYVFHMSGATGASSDMKLVVEQFHSHGTASINVLMAASATGARRILIAGSLTEPIPDPACEPVPGSPYAAGKWVGSVYGRMFHALYGTPVVNMRTFMTYGPTQAAGKLIPSTVRDLLRFASPQLTSGRTRGDWIFIDDVVDAYIAAAVTPGTEGRTFDVGTGRLTSIREIVEELARIVGNGIQPHFGAVPDRPMEQERVADVEATAAALGWRSRVALSDGLRRTVEGIRAVLAP